MFLSPEACERILVKDWVEYPRVSKDFISYSVIAREGGNDIDGYCIAKIYERYSWTCYRLWIVDGHEE